MNSAKELLAKLQTLSEREGVIDAALWLQISMKLRVLLQGEKDELIEMNRKVQELKSTYLAEGKSATDAKTLTETSDLFVETQKLENFIKTALDVILLAKKFATMETDIYKSM